MEREEMDQSGGSSGIGKRSRSEYECDGDTEHDVASAEDSGELGEGSDAERDAAAGGDSGAAEVSDRGPGRRRGKSGKGGKRKKMAGNQQRTRQAAEDGGVDGPALL